MIQNPKDRRDFAANFGITRYEFGKSANSKAEFVTDLLMDVDLIQTYIKNDLFPKRGNACRSFNKTCEFFGTCDFDVRAISEIQSRDTTVYESLSIEDADFVIDMEDIIEQIKNLDNGQDYVIMDPVVPQEPE